MGMIQNKVTVSQPVSHVIVQDAGGLRGLTGPQGIPGADGKDGKDGAAATISVGSTSTLPAGSSATVTNSGTSSAAVFDFGIPKGDKGDTGATGADGYSPSATVTKTGDTATITITDKDGTTTASISDGSTPTVNDGTLTIQKNGTTVQTFSADQASNVTANITVPTQFSDLSGTVSSSQIEDEAITTGTASATGTNITLAGTMDGGAIDSVEMYGDTQQTTYSGKNLLLPSPRSSASSGLTASYDTITGVIALSGIANNNWSNAFNDMTVNLPAGTYTFSATTESGLGRNLIMFNNGTNIGQVTLNSTTQSVQITVAQAVTSIRLWLTPTNGVNYTGKTFRAMVESGNQATSFEPYVGGTASPNPDYPQTVQTVTGEQVVTISDGQGDTQTYEVNLGKNLFDNSAVQIKTNATFTGTDGNVFTTSSSDYRDLAIVKVQPNTKVTFSINDTSTYPNTRLYVVGLRNTTTESGESFDWLSGTSTITTGKNTNYLGVIIQVRDSSNNTPVQTQEIVDSLKIQLEFGDTKTTYAPYFTPIELCKIGTYQDYIYKSGNDWYVHNAVGKLELDGTESWYLSGRTTKVTWNTLGITNVANVYNGGSVSVPAYLSCATQTYFDNLQPTSATGEGFALRTDASQGDISAAGNGIYLYYTGTMDTTQKVTTYLSNNKPTLYYALATPIDTQITNATLISELEGLLSATTYSGNTYITVSGDLASPLEVVAEADSKLAPDSVYGAAIKDGAVSVDKIADLKALADALAPYLNS